MTLQVGSRLGPYEILARLGAGGMGEVFRARDARLGRDVAVKVLPDRLTDDRQALARFEAEAKAVAALSHPNILAIYDVGETDGVPYAVTELLEGENLRTLLARGGVPVKRALEIGGQIASALASAQEKGIVHRDVKPENVFVTKDGHAKLLDFGLARRNVLAGMPQHESPTVPMLTQTGAVVGTVAYMSPEQASGAAVDHRSDQFSLGLVLYEMLAGKRAFARPTAPETLAAIIREEPEPLALAAPALPPPVAWIVERCLAKSPEERYDSTRDLARDLEACRVHLSAVTSQVAQEETVAAVPAAPAPFLTTPERKVFVAGAALFALLLAAAVGIVIQRRARGPALPAGPSIAVLPFANLSEDRSQEYFSDGLSEELMGLLSKVTDLRVAGRTSSFAFKGKNEDLKTIGRKLNVTAVLEGSVRRSGDQLRVLTRLVNVADGYQVWAERYDRKLTDVFAVQDEIAGAVVAALKVKLLARLPKSGHKTAHPEAFDQYLLAREYLGRGTPEALRDAVAACRGAIGLDADYAPAWAQLATAEYYLADTAPSAEEIAKGRARALEAAEKALALDPALAEGYTARARLRFARWEWAAAQADLERALALDPGKSSTLIVYAGLLSGQGRVPEAIARAKKATELDPLWAPAWVGYGWRVSESGDFAGARKALARALELDPKIGIAHMDVGCTHLFEKNPREALEEFRKEAWDVLSDTGAAMAEHDLGNARGSQDALDRLVAQHAQEAAYQIAEVHAWRGEKEKAFAWLERAWTQRDEGLIGLKVDRCLASLRDDPRFGALLAKVNLPGSTTPPRTP